MREEETRQAKYCHPPLLSAYRIWTGDTWVKWFEMRRETPLSQTLLWTLSYAHTYTRSLSHLFSALSLLITSNVTGCVFPPHCWELLPGFWTSQLPGNKPLPCKTDGTPLQCSTHAQAYTLKTPVRLHAGRSPIPTHRTSDSPQLLARHYFEEASLSFTSYSSLCACSHWILRLCVWGVKWEEKCFGGANEGLVGCVCVCVANTVGIWQILSDFIWNDAAPWGIHLLVVLFTVQKSPFLFLYH